MVQYFNVNQHMHMYTDISNNIHVLLFVGEHDFISVLFYCFLVSYTHSHSASKSAGDIKQYALSIRETSFIDVILQVLLDPISQEIHLFNNS